MKTVIIIVVPVVHQSYSVILFNLQRVSISNILLYILFNRAAGINLACLLLRAHESVNLLYMCIFHLLFMYGSHVFL